MLTDDDMLGRKKQDLNALKEIKVKVPVRHLLSLHFVKITSNQNISDVVSDALSEYFARMNGAKADDAAPSTEN